MDLSLRGYRIVLLGNVEYIDEIAATASLTAGMTPFPLEALGRRELQEIAPFAYGAEFHQAFEHRMQQFDCFLKLWAHRFLSLQRTVPLAGPRQCCENQADRVETAPVEQ